MALPKLTTALIGSFSVMIAMPAAAGPGPVSVEKSTEISILELDLSDATDARILMKNMQAAASRVCQLKRRNWTVQELHARKKCQRIAVEQAVDSLNEPILTAIFYGSLDE